MTYSSQTQTQTLAEVHLVGFSLRDWRSDQNQFPWRAAPYLVKSCGVERKGLEKGS